MSDLPPLTALRSFEAVARLGSISQAASELHVTHSAISQQIKLLENLLGLALFVREGRGLRLSENGRFYALQVRASLGEIADATRVVRARPREGELVVTVMPSFGLNWLLPRLPRFRERHPHCRVRLVASLDVQNLRQGLADLGVRIGKGDWEGVGRERLFDDELLMVAAPDFNGGRLPRTPSEIVACPTLRSTESWALWCQRAGVAEPQHGLLINDSNLLLEAVRLGQGIALERRSLVAGASPRAAWCNWATSACPTPIPTGWSGRSASRRATATRPSPTGCARRPGATRPSNRRSANEVAADLAEAVAAGAFHPFEGDHLPRHDHRPGLAHPLHGQRLVARPPRADRLLHDEHFATTAKQVEHGLQHADVRLAAANHELPAVAAGRAQQGAVGGGREVQLLEDLRGLQLIAQGRHRRPQALLYCSLASTGTSSARATRNNHWLYSTSAGPSSMAGSRRSWISTTSRVEVAARISMASSFGSTSRFVWLRLARHGRHGQRVLPQP